MTLSLYDTMTRSKRAFVPRDPDRVTMYVCGPTVYNFAHIGNFRPVVVFDLLFRVLRETFGEAAVLYAANVTDVDDKINRKAADEGVPIALANGSEECTAKRMLKKAMLSATSPSVRVRGVACLSTWPTLKSSKKLPAVDLLFAIGYCSESLMPGRYSPGASLVITCPQITRFFSGS